MKKILSWMLALAMLLACAAVFAEQAEEESVFTKLEGMAWSFSSGVGAWSTDLVIAPDGTFTGNYHDSEMGETGEGYPNGTFYGCAFSGRFSAQKEADNTWSVRVEELKMDEGQLDEAIEDGIRYVTAAPYGLSEGDVMRLYQPGTPLKALNEEMLIWTHTQFMDPVPDTLPDWFLCSEKNGSGFVGYMTGEEVGMANPWETLTAEELAKKAGVSLQVPAEAQNMEYRYLPEYGLAEIQFTLFEGDDFCARLQPAAEWLDISGMYFAWENEENVQVGGSGAVIGQAQTGSEDWVERLTWYDAERGLSCCLSVCTTEPDGLDLTALAEQIFLPGNQQ